MHKIEKFLQTEGACIIPGEDRTSRNLWPQFSAANAFLPVPLKKNYNEYIKSTCRACCAVCILPALPLISGAWKVL
jgi:hypothetical protein